MGSDLTGLENQPIETANSQLDQTLPLRTLIKVKTGQDVIRCLGCGTCNINRPIEDLDVSLDSIIRMILDDDEDALSTRTLWSETVIKSIRFACKRGLNLQDIFQIMRIEARKRGVDLESQL